MRVFRAELSVDRPFIFRVVIDDAGLRLLHVRPCLCERLLLRFPGRIVREKGYEPLRTVVPAAALDKAVQVANVAHRVDFDIQKQIEIRCRQTDRCETARASCRERYVSTCRYPRSTYP